MVSEWRLNVARFGLIGYFDPAQGPYQFPLLCSELLHPVEGRELLTNIRAGAYAISLAIYADERCYFDRILRYSIPFGVNFPFHRAVAPDQLP